MILSDGDIRRRLEAGDLVIEPLDDPDLQIQPASVDLRLGSQFIEFSSRRVGTIHPDREEEINNYIRKIELNSSGRPKDIPLEYFDASSESSYAEEDEYIIHPDEFVLGTTIEEVKIPPDLIAHVEGRSSLGRLAILVHATAGVVDPGYEGEITLELSNLGEAPVALQPGMRISQLTFTKLTSEVEIPYGEERGSKYQNQTGPQPSRIQNDIEYDKSQ